MKISADFWDDVKNCLSNPCSCGRSDKTETFQPAGDTDSLSDIFKDPIRNIYDYDPTIKPTAIVPSDPTNTNYPFRHTFKPNSNCPPYNRYTGRDAGSCLLQFRAPNIPFLPMYRAYCAQATPNTNFENPKIKFRMAACNIAFCFSQSAELNGTAGECKVYATQYGIPTMRVCARMAKVNYVPDETNPGTLKPEFDPGYQKYFLDDNGFPRPDPGKKATVSVRVARTTDESGDEDGTRDEDGTGDDDYTYITKEYNIFLHKICLYEDPSILEGFLLYITMVGTAALALLSGPVGALGVAFLLGPEWAYRNHGIDFKDSDLTVQNFHVGSKDNSIVEDSYYFNNSLVDYMHLWDNEAREDDDGWEETLWQTNYEQWVKNIIYKRPGGSLGCVALPIGPLPPPFCPDLKGTGPSVHFYEICPQYVDFDQDTNTYDIKTTRSTSFQPCVLSNKENNFVKNSFRVALDNYIPICADSTINAYESSTCVKFYSLPSPLAIHMNKDLLPRCSNAAPSDGVACVLTDARPASGDASEKFRVVYGKRDRASSSLTQLLSFPHDMPNLCNGSNYPCVEVMGVNNGPYKDVVFDLSNSSNVYSNNYTSTSTSLSYTDPTDSSKTYDYTITSYVSYAGLDKEVTADTRTLDPNSLCSFYRRGSSSYDIKSCIKRAPEPNIIAHTCDSARGGLSCTSTYLNPKMILEIGYKKEDGTAIGSTDTDYTTIAPNYSLYGIISPRELGSADDTSGRSEYQNIIGYKVDSLVVDENNCCRPPFSGPKAVPEGSSSISILGTYIGTNRVLNFTLDKDNTSKYLTGIEYINGNYFRGGKKLAVVEVGLPKCHEAQNRSNSGLPGGEILTYDNTMCVLSKLNYSNIVNCGTFRTAGAGKRCDKSDISAGNCTDFYINPTDSSRNCSASDRADGTCIQQKVDITHRPEKINIKICKTGTGYTAADCANGTRSGIDCQKCYVAPSDMDKPICMVSDDPSDRALPETTAVSLNKEQYYNYELVSDYITANKGSSYCDSDPLSKNLCYCNTTSTDSRGKKVIFDQDKCAARDKNILEAGVSVDVPLPNKCYAETASSSSGYASWTEAEVGGDSTGTCTTGYYPPSGGLGTRKCYLNSDNITLLEARASSQFCSISVCSAITTTSGSTGWARWSEAAYEISSTPSCPNGSYPLQDITRTCQADGTLSALPSGTILCKNDEYKIKQRGTSEYIILSTNNRTPIHVQAMGTVGNSFANYQLFNIILGGTPYNWKGRFEGYPHQGSMAANDPRIFSDNGYALAPYTIVTHYPSPLKLTISTSGGDDLYYRTRAVGIAYGVRNGGRNYDRFFGGIYPGDYMGSPIKGTNEVQFPDYNGYMTVKMQLLVKWSNYPYGHQR